MLRAHEVQGVEDHARSEAAIRAPLERLVVHGGLHLVELEHPLHSTHDAQGLLRAEARWGWHACEHGPDLGEGVPRNHARDSLLEHSVDPDDGATMMWMPVVRSGDDDARVKGDLHEPPQSNSARASRSTR